MKQGRELAVSDVSVSEQIKNVLAVHSTSTVVVPRQLLLDVLDALVSINQLKCEVAMLGIEPRRYYVGPYGVDVEM
jgi:hypothetical protein